MIRRAENRDISGIRQLLLQVLAVHNEGRADLFKPIGYKYTEEQLAEIIADDDRPIFVYVDDAGNVLGHCFCIINVIEETEAVYHYKNLYIDDLCIDEKHRGEKIGTEIYNYVKQYAKENGIYNITLHVWECNPGAKAFYEKIGLVPQQHTLEEII